MRTAYKIVIVFLFFVWLAAMYLVFTVTSNPDKAFNMMSHLAYVVASPYFIPGIFGFFILLVVILVGPVWAKMIAQKQLSQRLEKEGIRTMAEIIKVTDTGITINQNPRVTLTVNILGQGADFDITVSRVNIPKVGDTVAVLYDPQNPARAVYASN